MKLQKEYGLKLRSLFYLVPFEYLFEVKQIKYCYFQIDLPGIGTMGGLSKAYRDDLSFDKVRSDTKLKN
jgi:hypothetical protein